MMEKFGKKKVIISGGGSGIGKALISVLYEEGVKKFAVIGRDISKLKALESEYAEAEFLILKGDISVSEDIHHFSKLVSDTWGSADILINNAGVVSAGALEDISDADIIAQQNINVTGLILLTKHILPLLKKSKDAALINVSSGLALIGLPFYSPYAASKAAVKKFSEAIRRELKDFPIHVLTVYPTATDTPMMKTAQTGQMDTPLLVAQRTLEGLKSGVIDVILANNEDVKLNREKPVEFDKKAFAMYDAMASRTKNHRSM